MTDANMFSPLINGIIKMAGGLTTIQLCFFAFAILLRLFVKTPEEKRKRERAEYQKRREAYQIRKLEFDERREAYQRRKLEFDEKQLNRRIERERRFYSLEEKRKRARLSKELHSMRSTFGNRRFSKKWEIIGY